MINGWPRTQGSQGVRQRVKGSSLGASNRLARSRRSRSHSARPRCRADTPSLCLRGAVGHFVSSAAEPPSGSQARTRVTMAYRATGAHDAFLRDPIGRECKTITALINHGLDRPLPARNYATTAELRGKKRQRSRDLRRKPRHLDRCGAAADLGKIVIRLHRQPRVGGAAERLFEPKRHFRRDGTASGDEVVKLLAA